MRPVACSRNRTWRGADGKVVMERLCLSLPYVEKPFNSKVIKSFGPELRSRQVFFMFWDSHVVYMCIMNIMNVLRTGMKMSFSHIRIMGILHIFNE